MKNTRSRATTEQPQRTRLAGELYRVRQARAEEAAQLRERVASRERANRYLDSLLEAGLLEVKQECEDFDEIEDCTQLYTIVAEGEDGGASSSPGVGPFHYRERDAAQHRNTVVGGPAAVSGGFLHHDGG